MTETRAGLAEIAVVSVVETPHIATITAAGSQWVNLTGAELRTVALKPAEPGGEPQTVTRIRLAYGSVIFTLAEAAGEGGLLEASEAAQTIVAENTDAAGTVTGGSRTRPNFSEPEE